VCEGEDDVWGEIAMLKEHIRRLENRNNKEGNGNEIEEEVNEVLFSSCCMHFFQYFTQTCYFCRKIYDQTIMLFLGYQYYMVKQR
jgi:hypothetical protein